MKSYTPKSLRTLSKASAWYICALFLAVGVLSFPRLSGAALTSPVPVVTGSQYGTIESGAIEDLGLRQTVSNTQYEYGWSDEHPENRRMVSINVGTKSLLVVAFVNTNSPSSTCTGATPICKLEFRVSSDGGITWAAALEGSTPWLNIMGPKFDYTLYVDPINGQDIWVSYTYAVKTVTTGPASGTKAYTKSKIQQLVFNTVTSSSWGTTGLQGEPTFPSANPGQRCYDDVAKCTTTTAVAVQQLLSGGRRVWGVFSYTDSGNRYTSLAYNDSFPTTTTWIQVPTALSITGNSLNAASYMSDARLQAVPIGDNRVPMLFYADPDNYYGASSTCYHPDTGANLIAATPSGQYNSVLALTTSIVDHRPLAIAANGIVADLCGSALAASPTFGSPLGFSVAAYPTGPLTSRVVIAYSGGVNASNVHNNAIRTRQCTVTISENDGTPATVNCGTDTTLLNSSGMRNPSVGFDSSVVNGKAWIVARGVGDTIAIFEETTPGTWAAMPSNLNSSVGTTNVSAAVDFVPSGLTNNSGLFPFIWSDLGRSRIAFSANAGGTTIGTSPSITSNPIHGYGWSSNFGWLSVNCVNKPLVDCDSIFGMGIGSSPHSDGGELQDIVDGNTILSPTTNKTYPIGGYAWSSNAGFLSFERRDSIYNCGPVSGCSDSDPLTDDNDRGNPPGLPYNNAGEVDVNIPVAKYDTKTQHVYGWGRFLNLCNYDATNKRCQDKDNGWVRLRGYFTTGAPSQTGTLSTSTDISLSGPGTCGSVFGAGDVVVIGSEYSTVRDCPTNTILRLNNAIVNSTGAVTVYKVTNNDYGLDAFWTGNHYELAGWAWSYDYGWIRFNPLIFIGFAWIETLFGNVYSGDQVILPDAKDLTGTRIKTCGVNGNEDCYVATYRIEAKNNITGVTFSSTGEFVDAPVSAGGAIDKGGADCATDDIYCVLQGGATADVLTRSGLLGTKFPTVGSTTVSYRNALGKLDVGGLTTIVNDSSSGYIDKVAGSRGFYGIAGTDVNRFGNTVYKTTQTNPTTWTVQELAGWKNATWQSTEAPVLPLNVLTNTGSVAEKNTLRSQVVHVQGNLTVDGAHAELTNTIVGDVTTAPGATVNVGSVVGNFPTNTVDIGSGHPSCSGCALVVDPGGAKEEYFSYLGFNGVQFNGLRRIHSCPTSGCVSHIAGEEVRWVWRLPYENNSDTNLAQRTTIVIDGNLDIQYNIIAADRAADLDLGSTVLPDSIRDVPTLAFVVKGNVTIAKEVNKVTAAIIATGTDTAQEPLATGGIISTGDDNDPSICDASTKVCRPLTIIGLLFARQFQFQRIGNLEKNETPAERVIADERLFLNPPPGMEDVTKALPNPTRTLP